jgi:HAD superfamily hydrolase (TIGR01490 family)
MRALAVFDVDGTLLEGDSHVRLLRALVADGGVPLGARAGIIEAAVRYVLGFASNTRIKEVAARAFAGRRDEEVRAFCRAFAERAVLGLLRPALVAEVRDEARRGRLVVLLSASLEPIVAPVGAAVGADRVVAARLALANGIVTGALDGEVPYGPAKARALVQLATELGADLASSSGYGDHHADLDFLRLVGEPHAVSPDARLRAAARHAGWPIL